MEKNTKILLGLGAVIAAYLILKPKKAVVTPVTTTIMETGASLPIISTEQPIVSLLDKSKAFVLCPDGTFKNNCDEIKTTVIDVKPTNNFEFQMDSDGNLILSN
jgi:UDP-N-acetylmuramyl pentapeptide synthase